MISAERSLDGARIEAESSGPGLLVVNDAWDAGWHATLDGQPVEWMPADGAMRAVRWPGGRHVLAMAYDPVEVRVGGWLSLLGLGLLVAGVVRSRRREDGHRWVALGRGRCFPRPLRSHRHGRDGRLLGGDRLRLRQPRRPDLRLREREGAPRPLVGRTRLGILDDHGSNWHPLTWLSHMADVQVFGLEPGVTTSSRSCSTP